MTTGKTMKNVTLSAVFSIALLACTNGEQAQASSDDSQKTASISPVDQDPFQINPVAEFDEPWAMTFLPDGQMLVTTKPGKLFQVSADGREIPILGVPEVDYGNQGGLGDIILAPDFSESNTIYLSWVEAGDGDTRGAVVGRAQYSPCPIDAECEQPELTDLQIIWKQNPKTTGRGHYSHRLVFSPDGKYLFIGSGERQKFDPSQDMGSNLGKIVRLNPDGSIPADNPFVDQEGALPEIWSLGHRNILGIAFDSEGKLWNQEMGPLHGDELNLVKRAANYGYPIVSNGDHYDGKEIPDHDTRPEFEAPKVWWDQSIAPGGLIFYSGDEFPAWQGSAFIGGLASEALIRISFDGDTAQEAERFPMGKRIREVEQGPAGAIWVLEDGDGGRLLKLTK
ncbi:MAG: PQQ-dependent sugar dehydrogenase [Parasphingorhabdus sp.]